ncbi:MAG: hypothetical protein WC279_11850, partial [Sulfurimonas sp.]|uniref:hypothetical protein n=1 Tax=Sulfurimonas sp. TaxID=2022749 RepID=UPI0035623FF5
MPFCFWNNHVLQEESTCYYTLVVTGRGFAMGGYATSAVSSEIDGLEFASDAAVNPAAVLAVARTSTAGVNSDIRGYAMGGGGPTKEIDGIEFATELAINTA